MRIHGTEYDSLTGVKTTYGSEDDKMIVKTEQDIEPALELMKAWRNDPEHAKDGIKRNWQFACHIPNSVIAKMKTDHGFDVLTSSAKEIRDFLVKYRDTYGYLFATAGKI